MPETTPTPEERLDALERRADEHEDEMEVLQGLVQSLNDHLGDVVERLDRIEQLPKRVLMWLGAIFLGAENSAELIELLRLIVGA